MNLKQQRAAAYTAANDIMETARKEGRDLTDDESATVDEKIAEVKSLDERIAKANDSQKAFNALGQLKDDEPAQQTKGDEPKSLGEHAAKHMHERLRQVKDQQGTWSVAAPEWVPGKAANDTFSTVNTVFQDPILTQWDRGIQRQLRQRLIVADLLGSGTISGTAISYFVEQPAAWEGSFATVAEGGQKPQMHMLEPTAVTETLKKIAGFIKLTDEMVEDLSFFVSEVNNRLLYELAAFEERQLLDGDGTGTNILGLLRRSGVQLENRGTAASGDTAADTIFRAMTKVTTGSGLDPDGLVINPADYQALRLARDANDQYYGGGYFQGQYGTGGFVEQPPVWGLRTVVSPAVTAGTALVGAFRQGATVYRKGGVRVESTNSDGNDFTQNRVTTRAEERLALAVRNPAAYVKTTLTPAP